MNEKNKLICIFIAFLLIFSASSFAGIATYNPGPYIGFQGGIGRADEGDGYSAHLETYANQSIGNKSFKKTTGGGAGRVFLGYNFVKYFSVEAGYSLLANNNYKYNNSTLSQYLDIKVETYTVDLVGKFILPLRDSNWNLYAKLGGAYVNDKIVGTVQNIPGYSSATKNYNAICPAYGLGITYNWNETFGMDLAWLGTYSNKRFEQSDANPDAIKPVPTTNTFMLGITYKFTRTL